MDIANKDGKYRNFIGIIDYHCNKANVVNATFELKDGRIYWEKGIWEYGTWKDGTWWNGTWQYGDWGNGTWENGRWEDGWWYNGTWKGGDWGRGRDGKGKGEWHMKDDSPDKW